EERRAAGSEPAAAENSRNPIERLREFIWLPDTLGRPPDQQILERILIALGDCPFEQFEERAYRWCRRNKPESYWIFVTLAADAMAAWEQDRPMARENPAHSEPPEPRRTVASPEMPANAPAVPETQIHGNVPNARRPGLRPIGGGWLSLIR